MNVMQYEDLSQPKRRTVTKRKEFNITKLTKTAILKHLLVRFVKDYQTDLLVIAVSLEFAWIVVRTV